MHYFRFYSRGLNILNLDNPLHQYHCQLFMREIRIDCFGGNLLTAINFHDNLRKSCIVYIILRRYIHLVVGMY